MIHSAAGVSSTGTPVSFKSVLTITGNTLTIALSNLSTAASIAPNDVLSSYYFDIINNASVRPTLTYVSAVGNVWLTKKNAIDTLQTANANLKAVNPGDYTWQFKAMTPTLFPFMGFGVGTVGNNSYPNLIPAVNGFNGNIVDGLDYSIYSGDVTTQNLNNKLMVKGAIMFTFTGVSGFSEADISPVGRFGQGTAPDSLLTTSVPEPASVSLLVLSSLAVLSRQRRA